MFSAIFGNIFYGRVEEQIQDESASKFSEASTQTFDNKLTSTHVNLEESKYNENKLNDTVNSQQLDWVIIDESPENEKGVGSNLVEMTNSVSQESDDPLIGSFFQRNEVDDNKDNENKPIEIDQTDNESKTVENQTVLPEPKKETWLITPLPCLTSITESSQQKSMIDNDPMENLLIEQPTRFMSASTTTATESANTTTTPVSKRRVKKQQKRTKDSEVMQSDDVCFIEDLFKETEPETPVIVKKTVGEKRKEAEKSSPISPTLSVESPKKVSRKAAKNFKKSSNNTQKGLNKENMQVKTLLFAECFSKEPQNKNNHTRYGQMLRANKNCALFSMAGNAKQRKFHNLQQPSMNIMNNKNQKF